MNFLVNSLESRFPIGLAPNATRSIHMNIDVCFFYLMAILCIVTFNVSIEILSNRMIYNIAKTQFFDITRIV